MVQAELSQDRINKAKSVIFKQLSRRNVAPVIEIVNAGFPINVSIMDTGANLLQYAASTCNDSQIE